MLFNQVPPMNIDMKTTPHLFPEPNTGMPVLDINLWHPRQTIQGKCYVRLHSGKKVL